jgi:choline monooxygenase
MKGGGGFCPPCENFHARTLRRQPLMRTLEDIIRGYDARLPLSHASTIPAEWYTDARIFDLERRAVFAPAWQVAGRTDQLERGGDFVACELAGGEPIVIVRGADGLLRAFFNVCRHHAAAVVTHPHGSATVLRCPYHGWTYGLDGTLKGTPDFAGVCAFDRAEQGLVPVDVAVWGPWVFARIGRDGPSLEDCLGADLLSRLDAMPLSTLHWAERRVYSVDCNWKVFVDNYLDGGYHVPHLHKGLDSVLDYSEYTIECGVRYCLQASPIVAAGAEAETGAVRTGDRASYFWVYPNFAINIYAGAMDTNLIVPRGVGRTDVIFDFYFDDVSDERRPRNEASIAVSERIQDEDVAICASVQRGLLSGAYTAGRLSVRREAGEQSSIGCCTRTSCAH